jgi:predicted dehydrogenase
MSVTSIAVLGAGMIGKRHVEQVALAPEAKLHAVVDPSPAGKDIAAQYGTKWYPDFAAMMKEGRPDGVMIATPNQLHVEHGLQAIAAGLPSLIEKPLADDIEGAKKLVAAAEKAGVPILTGHHRRHNPMIQRAKEIVASGRLGKLVTVHAFFWLMKPSEYFEPQWRREIGAGPMLLNFIHDIDLLRYLCGEVDMVQAFQSNAVRGYPVDETTVVNVKFKDGLLGTVNVTDTAVAPWSWEQTTGENPVYPATDQPCYFIGGTRGSLSIPRLEVWTNEDKLSWWEPFVVARTIAPKQDPLLLQVQQFCRVIRGEEKPLVSGYEGMMTLKCAVAVQKAARTGQTVRIDDL